jgi:aldehyde dehydrogenase (NAD+)
VQGLGEECGGPIVTHSEINVLSFTGSTQVGRHIAVQAAQRLVKVSLELGGKNPLIVCDDADIDNAVKWVCLSAFSNAGQRCAAGSRIIIFESVYDDFKKKLITSTEKLKIGPNNGDDLGPLINERQLLSILSSIEEATSEGAKLLAGGFRLEDSEHKNGFYLSPTIIENIPQTSKISDKELFGPVAQLYVVKDYEQAMNLANESPYGLTACIHTMSFDRAYHFTQEIFAGVAVVNAGTYGSEPHMPFGGTRDSGNGSREPGTEALDVYSELKDIYLNVDRSKL